MVKQDVCKRFVFFVGVKGREVNARVGKGLVGRGKHRERTVTSKRCGEVHMVERRHQRVMHACSSGVGGDVLGFVSGDAEREGGKTQAGNK